MSGRDQHYQTRNDYDQRRGGRGEYTHSSGQSYRSARDDSTLTVRDNERRDADRRRDRHRMEWQDDAERLDQRCEEKRKEPMPKTSASSVASTSSSSRESGSRGESSSSSTAEEQVKDPREQDSPQRRSPVITNIFSTKPSNEPSKQGTSGERVQLVTNYFSILKKPSWVLYMYRVDFSPETEIRSLKAGMLFGQIKSFGPRLFDGTVLYLLKKLERDVTVFMTKSDKTQQPFQITVKLVGLVSPGTYQYLHVWSVLLRKCEMALGLILVGRNYYDPKAAVPIDQYRLQLWPGYVTSIRQHDRDLLLCADISTKVMRKETALDILLKCHSNNRFTFKATFISVLAGATVLTAYNNKTYKITDVDFDQTPQSTFTLKDGTVTSFIQYYKDKHNIQIRDVRQPLLLSMASKRELRAGKATVTALIPELCLMTGFSDEMCKNRNLMKTVSNYTKLDPNERIKRIRSLNERFRRNEVCREHFRDFDFQLDTDLLKLEGRCLKNEEILFGKQKRCTPKPNAAPNLSQLCHNNGMFLSQPLTNWVLIHLRKDSRCVQDFIGVLRKAAAGMNYPISDPYTIEIHSDREWKNALDSGYQRDPQLFVCFVSNQQPDVYCTIKKLCCCEYGIPSQVLVADRNKNSKNAMSIATKVAIQINTKLGGVPWLIAIPLSGLMTIGFDVCHDTVTKTNSHGAMVATMDMRQKQKYFSTVSTHVKGVELSNDFALNIRKAIKEYRDNHETLPAKILIYRDGVGEGQTKYVVEIEIKNIVNSLQIEYGDRKVPLTFIVVSKKINTRFFGEGGRGFENPRPGTVVDDEVTLPERHEFFLVSQSARVGTVSPTNYNILHNEMGLSSDQLQRLTYKQTHLYYNWPGTVAVPAVCQYAHKLAFMVGNFLHAAPTNGLHTEKKRNIQYQFNVKKLVSNI